MFKTIKRLINEVKEDKPEPVIFKGKNLDHWHYLGSNNIYFVDKEGNRDADTDVYFFLHKKTERRDFVVQSIKDHGKYSIFNNHPFVTKACELWKIKEYDLIALIRDQPSEYLKELLLEQHNAVWDPEEKWWSTDDNAKYSIAKKKQEESKPEVEELEEKVVRVKFGNKD